MATHSKNSSLGNPMDKGAWGATVPRFAKQSDVTKELNNKKLPLSPGLDFCYLRNYEAFPSDTFKYGTIIYYEDFSIFG